MLVYILGYFFLVFTDLRAKTDAALHSATSLDAVLSAQEKECWKQYTIQLQLLNGNSQPYLPQSWFYNYLTDGDAVGSYCELLAELLENPPQSGGRRRRFTLNLNNNPDKKWDVFLDFPIKYKFYTNGFADDGTRTNIRRALQLIERTTCVEFQEISDTDPYSGSHIEFMRSQTCSSFVGRSLSEIPQPIFLSGTCLAQWGDVTHEVLHAIGFWHTHQRHDRDTVINFIAENLQPQYQGQFNPLPERLGLTFNRSYDFSSIMHFHGKQFAENGGLVLETLDPLWQRTIGQRVELSFDDALITNTIYCGHVCEGFELTCQNGGYIDPKDCGQCRCPDGFSGRMCNQLSPPVQDDCGVQSVTATAAVGYLMSPNYGVGWYKNWQECTWRITAPGGLVEFWFEDDFGVYCRSPKTCYHWVEVRYRVALNTLGPRFCCDDLPYGPTTTNRFTSTSSEVLVLFRARWNETTNNEIYRLGFKLAYRRILTGVCENITCSNQGVCNGADGSCICNPGYTGPDCSEEVDFCSPNPCVNGLCFQDGLDFRCSCFPGFRGPLCETEISECDSSPCQNRGVCVDAVNGYMCDCMPGYTGLNCQIEINECASNPCLNSGVCRDLVNSYICTCPNGFTGINCQTDINECASAPCQNGGTCLDRNNSYQCQCRPQFQDINCQTAITITSTSTTTTTARPTTTTIQTTSTTRTPTTTTRAPTTTTTQEPGICPPDRWGDQCQYPKTCGGHSPGSGPGVLDTPCNHEFCRLPYTTRTCTSSWWFKLKCKYVTRYRQISCTDRLPACDESIRFFLVDFAGVKKCAQAGYQFDECDCCTHHCDAGCEGWHRNKFYWGLMDHQNQLVYMRWNSTCVRYRDSACRP